MNKQLEKLSTEDDYEYIHREEGRMSDITPGDVQAYGGKQI
jgi:hypothetical protein